MVRTTRAGHGSWRWHTLQPVDSAHPEGRGRLIFDTGGQWVDGVPVQWVERRSEGLRIQEPQGRVDEAEVTWGGEVVDAAQRHVRGVGESLDE